MSALKFALTQLMGLGTIDRLRTLSRKLEKAKVGTEIGRGHGHHGHHGHHDGHGRGRGRGWGGGWGGPDFVYYEPAETDVILLDEDQISGSGDAERLMRLEPHREFLLSMTMNRDVPREIFESMLRQCGFTNILFIEDDASGTGLRVGHRVGLRVGVKHHPHHPAGPSTPTTPGASTPKRSRAARLRQASAHRARIRAARALGIVIPVTTTAPGGGGGGGPGGGGGGGSEDGGAPTDEADTSTDADQEEDGDDSSEDSAEETNEGDGDDAQAEVEGNGHRLTFVADTTRPIQLQNSDLGSWSLIWPLHVTALDPIRFTPRSLVLEQGQPYEARFVSKTMSKNALRHLLTQAGFMLHQGPFLLRRHIHHPALSGELSDWIVRGTWNQGQTPLANVQARLSSTIALEDLQAVH